MRRSSSLSQSQTRRHCGNNVLFIGNLSYFCEESQIIELFRQYGEPVHVEISRNRKQNKTLMYGFVTMVSGTEAENMVHLLDGYLFMGRKLRYDNSLQYI